MKVSSVKGLANHDGPESCVAGRNPRGEALTGDHAGRVLSREKKMVWDADPVGKRGRPQPRVPQGRGALVSHEVRDPRHAWEQSAREPGDPAFTQAGTLGTHREV
jgi:hypothetical protein